VMVERPYDPVAPEVDARSGGHHRTIQAIQIRGAEHVQPIPAPSNAVLFVFEKKIDRLLIGIGGGIGGKSLPLRPGWWRADQVQIDPAKECQLVCLPGGPQSFGFVVRRDKRVDRICGCSYTGGDRWLHYRLKRPESGSPLCELLLYRFGRRLGSTDAAQCK